MRFSPTLLRNAAAAIPERGKIAITSDRRGLELRIVDGSDNVRIYYLDGEKHKRQTPGGVDLETVAQKRGDQIIIEEKAESSKFTRTFALAQDGSVMVVTVRLENDRFKQPVVIRSVYDLLRDSETL